VIEELQSLVQFVKVISNLRIEISSNLLWKELSMSSFSRRKTDFSYCMTNSSITFTNFWTPASTFWLQTESGWKLVSLRTINLLIQRECVCVCVFESILYRIVLGSSLLTPWMRLRKFFSSLWIVLLAFIIFCWFFGYNTMKFFIEVKNFVKDVVNALNLSENSKKRQVNFITNWSWSEVKWNKSNHIRSNEIKSNHIKWNEMKSNQIRSNIGNEPSTWIRSNCFSKETDVNGRVW
jgi:hypothetical protein